MHAAIKYILLYIYIYIYIYTVVTFNTVYRVMYLHLVLLLSRGITANAFNI